MKKIILMQSCIIIPDYELGECPELESYFTLFDNITFTEYLYGIIYNEELKELRIPRGLDVKFIEELLNRKAVINHKYDNFENIIPYNLKLTPRDDDQIKTIKFLSGIEEYSYTKYESQLALNLDTGSGKTYCSVVYLGMMSCRGIIITSSSAVIQQWIDRYYQYTDISRNEILVINSSKLCIRIIKNHLNIDKYKVILVTHSTLRSFASLLGWEMVGELFKSLKIGVKFYDECHKDFTNMFYIDYYTNTYKTIYISATLNRSCNKEDFVFQLYLKNVPYINLFDPDKNNRTKYIALKYESSPQAKDRQYISDYRYGINRLRYIDYITSNEEFYKMCLYVFNLIYTKLIDDEKCLIYIGTNEGIIKVYKWFCEMYPYNIEDIGIFTSILPNKEKYTQQNKKIILTTTKSAGEAIDIQNLKITVVLAEPFKSKVIAKQSLGRTRNNNTLYIELVDVSFKKLIDYYNFKKSVFSKHATSCISTKIDKNFLNDVKEPNYILKFKNINYDEYLLNKINNYENQNKNINDE